MRLEIHSSTFLFFSSISAVLGYWFAALSPNMDVANAILPLYVTIQLMFSGFLIPTAFMRDYWRWAAEDVN